MLRRDVAGQGKRVVCMEAHITKHENQTDGITWLKIYEKATPENFNHCYIDSIDAELILDCIENYVAMGKGPEVAEFLRQDGRSIGDPIAFRIKLETALGGGLEAAENLF